MLDHNTTMKVAVYGTLRKTQGNHRLMHGAEFLGETHIPATMYHLGGFPAIALDDPVPRAITIEVYRIDDDILKGLDRLEGYPYMYNRSVVNTEFGDAWIYHMTTEELFERPIIESGNWADRKKLTGAAA